MDISGDKAYLAGDGDLIVASVADPSTPRRLAFYDVDDMVWDVASSGSLVCLIGGKLHVFDVTDPTSPVLLGTCGAASGYGVSISSGMAYIADPSGYLRIVDISNPSSPTLVGSCATSGEPEDVIASGTMAYVACVGGGLVIVDATDPSSPVLRSRYLTLGAPTDVAVKDGVAYVANRGHFLSMVDVANPSSPRIRGALELPNWSTRVCLSDDRAYVALGRPAVDTTERGGLAIADVGNPTSPTLLATYSTTGTVEGLAVSGPFAYIAESYFIVRGHLLYGRQALHVLDVSDPSAPTSRSVTIRPGQEVRDAALLSPTLVCVADRYGFSTFDVQDPSSPILRSYFTDNEYAMTRRIDCRSSTVYMTMDWQEWPSPYVFWDVASMLAADLSNPDAPRLAWYFYSMRDVLAGDIHVSGDRVAALVGYLDVFDLSGATPNWIGYNRDATVTFWWTGVFIDGDYIYMVDAYRGLWIFHFPQNLQGCSNWTLYR
jgi:hypothetical protein